MVQSEFTLLLFPILLSFLKSRIPHLLAHSALLAHTIYQTILFDESVKTNGFDLKDTTIGENQSGEVEWEGLSGVILRQEGWFDQWVDGERKCESLKLSSMLMCSWGESSQRDYILRGCLEYIGRLDRGRDAGEWTKTDNLLPTGQSPH
jgi:hypothetical protein